MADRVLAALLVAGAIDLLVNQPPSISKNAAFVLANVGFALACVLL